MRSPMSDSPWAALTTEQINPESLDLDQLSPEELVELMVKTEREALQAIAQAIPAISRGVELVTAALSGGGRLFYMGAGTSGRLGVLDAAECPPTFGTDPGMVQGIIAGGPEALVRSVEGAEDDPQAGRREVAERRVKAGDVLVGISASSVAPFVRAGLAEARHQGATTILLTCNPQEQIRGIEVDHLVPLETGPEILAGSTRLKAGSATKLVLNILSTGAMVGQGKVYGNLMVDLRPWSAKLRDRTVRIISLATGVDRKRATALLDASGGETKVGIVMDRLGISAEEARRRLAEAGGHLRRAIGAGPAYEEELRRGRERG